MDFTFSDEQRMMAEVARDMLVTECSSAAMRHQMKSGAARDDVRWAKICEMGLPAVLAPEASGGLGLAETDFVLIAEACGYTALPEPLVEHAGIAFPLLVEAGGEGSLLERATSGEVTIAVGHPANPFVSDADTAEALLLAHRGEVHLVETRNAGLVRQESIDPFRRLFRIEWAPTSTTRIATAAEGDVLWTRALDRGALFAAAQCLGLAQRAVDLATDYAKERQQFGKPIGSTQAIKHLLSTVQVKIEFAKPVVHAAAAELSARSAYAAPRISQAKLAASEAADLAARTAVQVHGAMGYSWEVDVHFFLKRALALTHAWGTPAFHRARVAQRIFEGPLGPDRTFIRESAHA